MKFSSATKIFDLRRISKYLFLGNKLNRHAIKEHVFKQAFSQKTQYDGGMGFGRPVDRLHRGVLRFFDSDQV